jgi:hypothetical protein
MAIINRLPKGLLAFLDQQVQGKNPQEPVPGLTLVSDVSAHYRSQEIKSAFNTVTITTTNVTTIISSGIAQISVPEGEVWELFGCHAQLGVGGAPLAANVAARISIQIRTNVDALPGTQADYVVVDNNIPLFNLAPISGSATLTWQPSQRLILNSGTLIRARITDSAAMVGLTAPQLGLVAAFYPWAV